MSHGYAFDMPSSVTVYSRFPPVCCWAVSCTRCRCRVVGMQVDCHVLRNPDGLGVRPCNRPACICWACPGGCGGSCGRPMPYTHSGEAAVSSSRSAPGLPSSCGPGFGRFRLHLDVHSTFAGGALGVLVVWKSWRATLPSTRKIGKFFTASKNSPHYKAFSHPPKFRAL